MVRACPGSALARFGRDWLFVIISLSNFVLRLYANQAGRPKRDSAPTAPRTRLARAGFPIQTQLPGPACLILLGVND